MTSARPGALPEACYERRRVSRTAPGGLREERGPQLGHRTRQPREAWRPRRGGGRRKETRAVRACARPRHVVPEELPAGPARRGAVHPGLCESEIFLCLGLKKKKKKKMTIQWVAVASFLYAEIGLILIFCLPFIPPQR